MAVIDVNDVEKEYDSVRALDGISLEINKGEFYGFLGKNGVGKTTLINILTGQTEADTGTVDVFGQSARESGDKIRERVGILPEQEVPPSFLTPVEYFDFVGDVRGIDKDVIDERVSEWSELLSITDKLDSLNKTLSRGQQQKVMLTAAFLHNPDIVFIDEPLVNLDPIVQESVKQFFKDYHDEGNTLVLSTHYTEAAEELCSRVGFIDEGKMVAERRTDSLADDEQLMDILAENSTEQ